VTPVTETVLVLNADLGPLHRVTFRHAVRMLLRGVAEVHEADPERSLGELPWPKVLRLARYVVSKWRYSDGPTWSRRGVLERDERTCQYCGAENAHTIDHVVPRSQGGRSTWKNTVAACDPCNQRKRDRTPAQAGMVLLRAPGSPTWGTLRR
jgi:5-methylcytosine-specific restriction endonuclease McrA